MEYLHSSLNDPNLRSTNMEDITRTFKIFRFDPHPRRRILILRGEVSVLITNPLSNAPLAEETQEFRKLIALENLTKSSNTDSVVQRIIKSCPIIDPRFHSLVGFAIDKLKSRNYDEKGVVRETSADSQSGIRFPDYFEDSILPGELDSELKEKVEMANIESYVELLYENLQGKLRGARCIAKLSKISENLVAIAGHETALNALFRTLREDYRKSIELSTQILTVCWNFSQFKDFHKLLFAHKICSMACDIIEFEMGRYDKWKKELHRRHYLNSGIADGNTETESKYRMADLEKMNKKFGELTRKQDNLLSLAMAVTLHLSENDILLEEIINRGILPLLIGSLERKNLDLLTSTLSFLHNLSVSETQRAEMKKFRVVEKITHLLSSSIPKELLQSCLQLLYHLAFDPGMRQQMVKYGLLLKLSYYYFEDTDLRNPVQRILYLISNDKKWRLKYTETDLLTHIVDLCCASKNKDSSDDESCMEIKAIAVNLARVKKCSQIMSRNEGVLKLLKAAFENEDPVIMKILKNMSLHLELRVLFQDFTPDLSRAIQEANNQDFVVECIGTLSNLDMPEIDFCRLLTEFDLVPWILTVLRNCPKAIAFKNISSSDKVLAGALLKLLGTCAVDEECTKMFIQEGILHALIQLVDSQGHNETLKLQGWYALYKICFHEQARRFVMEKTKLAHLAFSMLSAESTPTGLFCESILEMLGEENETWKNRLLEHRFQNHNGEWVEMIHMAETNPMAAISPSFGDFNQPFRPRKSVIELPVSVRQMFISTISEDDNNEIITENDGIDNTSDDDLFAALNTQYELDMKRRKKKEKLHWVKSPASTITEEDDENGGKNGRLNVDRSQTARQEIVQSTRRPKGTQSSRPGNPKNKRTSLL